MAAVEQQEAETELGEADAAAMERFFAIAGRAGALTRCEPQVVDIEVIGELLGPYLARNLEEVALAFGVTLVRLLHFKRPVRPCFPGVV